MEFLAEQWCREVTAKESLGRNAQEAYRDPGSRFTGEDFWSFLLQEQDDLMVWSEIVQWRKGRVEHLQ